MQVIVTQCDSCRQASSLLNPVSAIVFGVDRSDQTANKALDLCEKCAASVTVENMLGLGMKLVPNGPVLKADKRGYAAAKRAPAVEGEDVERDASGKRKPEKVQCPSCRRMLSPFGFPTHLKACERKQAASE